MVWLKGDPDDEYDDGDSNIYDYLNLSDWMFNQNNVDSQINYLK